MHKQTIIVRNTIEFNQSNRLRRDRLQIFAEILSLCQKQQVKTGIMYQLGTSYNSLQNYITQLQAYGLLKFDGTVKRYATTAKGKTYINNWSEIQKLLQM